LTPTPTALIFPIMKQLELSKEERIALEKLKGFLRENYGTAKILIFGSKAKGYSDDESDLDVLILLPHKVDRFTRKRIIHAVFDINLEHGTNISPIIYSMEDWEQGPVSILPFRETVEKEGVAI